MCVKDTESKNVKAAKTNEGKLKLLSKCAVCDSKKKRFIKNQRADRLINSLGLKKLLSKPKYKVTFFIEF